jgi:hypothetical protein
MNIRRCLPRALAVMALLVALAPATASAAVSESGWGFSIADDYTPDWSDPDYFPQFGSGFQRLDPKVFRLQVVWNAMEGGTDPNAIKRKQWRERTHGMIQKAKERGVELIILSLRGNYPDNVGADGYFGNSSAYYAKIKPLVQEFADEVDIWSPANEPNAKWRPDNAPGGGQALSAEYAAAYYLRMREAVASYDPGAYITSPDFLDSPGFKGYVETYKSYIPPGIPKWGNAAAFHPYRGVEQSASGGIWTTDTFASLLPSEFPIWITEVGAHADKFGIAGQAQQVSWIVNTLGGHPNVTRISYYDMLDRPITWDTALLNEDHSPRPAWYTWCAAAHGGDATHPDCSALDVGRPAAIARDAGIISLFTRGEDNAVWHKSFTPANGWSAWQSLGGVVTSSPSAISRDGGIISVFARSTDNTLHHKSFTPANGWSAWQSLGGNLTTAPAAISRPEGIISIFSRAPDYTLQHKSFTPANGWSAWQSLGGLLASDPAAMSREGGIISVVALGATPGVVEHKSYTPANGWSPWGSLGGTLSSSPAAIARDAGVLSIFGRGTDRTLHHKSFTPANGWSAWQSLGGALSSGPGAISRPEGITSVFARGMESMIEHKSYTPAGGWSEWQSLGAP